MASVYLARGFGSAGFERLAAVKLLHRALCTDQDFVEMFLDEARVAARLHHPNATAILDVGAEGPQLFMVMDYVEGDTLHAVQCAASALRRAVPLGIALRVILDALAGLDAAHELRGPDGTSLGLIHRDATPHNVLIGVDGAARLVDFGIARAAGRIGVTSVGVLKGKLPFMAPEQILGRAVDRRVDVFAMGVTLWETMALRRCFPSREGAPLSRLADEGYRPLREVAPQVPEALDAICRRALAFDRADRFPTAAAFAEAIEDAFRADLATQRELGQFMSVVAADKLFVEREAARRSSHPIPTRSVSPSRTPTPVPAMDLRPPRVPTFGPPSRRPLQSPLGDGLLDGEDVTAIAHPSRPPPAPVAQRRPLTLPPLPPLAAASKERASIAPKPERADASALPDVPTQAFPLQRPRPSLVSAPKVEARAAAAPPPESAVDEGRVSEVRIAVPSALATAVAEFNVAPVVLELPRPVVLSAPPPPPKPEGRFRALLRRLWSRG
jgi:serine/threonine-protein kinase